MFGDIQLETVCLKYCTIKILSHFVEMKSFNEKNWILKHKQAGSSARVLGLTLKIFSRLLNVTMLRKYIVQES